MSDRGYRTRAEDWYSDRAAEWFDGGPAYVDRAVAADDAESKALALDAEDEARAILEESEPAALRLDAPISVPDFMVHLERAEPADGALWHMRSALAEALAAFVGEGS